MGSVALSTEEGQEAPVATTRWSNGTTLPSASTTVLPSTRCTTPTRSVAVVLSAWSQTSCGAVAGSTAPRRFQMLQSKYGLASTSVTPATAFSCLSFASLHAVEGLVLLLSWNDVAQGSLNAEQRRLFWKKRLRFVRSRGQPPKTFTLWTLVYAGHTPHHTMS